jgi:hypothetical protein
MQRSYAATSANFSALQRGQIEAVELALGGEADCDPPASSAISPATQALLLSGLYHQNPLNFSTRG